jgi:hypothetical protein
VAAFSSSGDGEPRLETTVASGGLQRARKLREKARQGHQSMRQREGSRRKGSRGEGEFYCIGNVDVWRRIGSDSDERFEQPGGSKSRRERKGKERRVRGLIGEVLMAINPREINRGSNSGDRFQNRERKEKFAGGRR